LPQYLQRVFGANFGICRPTPLQTSPMALNPTSLHRYSMGSSSLIQLSMQPIFYEEPDSALTSSPLEAVQW
jgi:hypothetical protein